MSYKNYPFVDTSSVRAFSYTNAQINRIALALSAYLLFCLYPAYGLLRGWWTRDFSAFDLNGLLVAVTTSVVFGLFARATILKYLKIN